MEAATVRARVGGTQDSQSSPVTQYWSMGFNFVQLVVEFCIVNAECTTMRDQNMYYDSESAPRIPGTDVSCVLSDTLNMLNTQWPETYTQSLENVLSGQAQATGCWTLWGLGVAACGYMFFASLAWKATRHKVLLI